MLSHRQNEHISGEGDWKVVFFFFFFFKNYLPYMFIFPDEVFLNLRFF